ncbi:MAG: TRAP transporter small permease subunit [Pseudomonadota bacterium]|nr:TRAP transporter small permease subunit [Pseudomonadota bacterium]
MKDNNNGTDAVLILVDKLVRPVALYAGGAALIGLSLITVIAVIFRYIFNSPIFGADDFNQMFLMATVAFGVAYSGRKGGQVVVEILTVVSGPTFIRRTDIFVKLLGFVMMCVLTWVLVESGINAAEYGETTRSLEITLKPFFWLLAFGMGLYGFVLLSEMVTLLRGREMDY